MTKLEKFNSNLNQLVKVLAICLALFSISYAFFPYNLLAGRSIHLFFIFPISFISEGIIKATKKNIPRTAFYLFMALISMAACIYLWQNATPLSRDRMGMYTEWDLVCGLILIISVIVATWKHYGIAMLSVVAIFVLYLFFGKYLPSAVGHPGISYTRMISTLSLYTEGIFGTALGAIVSTVSAVLIFASFLEVSGGTKLFMDLSIAIFGRFSGGAAKVAVVASSLFGTISGSAAANVAGTGVITIPLMKKTGFEPHYAGAVEAAASSGGQIMPPVMGAAAFIIAEMLGLPYVEILKAAIVPAAVYYIAIFMAVHLYSRKHKIYGIPADPDDENSQMSVKELLLKGGYLLIPIVLLVVLVGVFNKSAQYAALLSTVAVIALSWLRKDTRITPKKMFEALRMSAMSIVPISIICAAAGLIMGIFTVTGLGLKLSAYIVSLAGNSLMLLCFFAFVASIILGMGLPTVACYLLLAVLVAPAMVDFGVVPLAAHLFVFYFGIISAITPPVAIAAYVGAGIAKAKPMKVGFTACAIALPAFLVPFVFVYQPALLMIGTFWEIFQVCVSTLLGSFLCAIGTQGYMFTNLRIYERVLAIACALCMLIPETITDIVGLAGGILILSIAYFRAKREKCQLI